MMTCGCFDVIIAIIILSKQKQWKQHTVHTTTSTHCTNNPTVQTQRTVGVY